MEGREAVGISCSKGVGCKDNSSAQVVYLSTGVGCPRKEAVIFPSLAVVTVVVDKDLSSRHSFEIGSWNWQEV